MCSCTLRRGSVSASAFTAFLPHERPASPATDWRFVPGRGRSYSELLGGGGCKDSLVLGLVLSTVSLTVRAGYVFAKTKDSYS